MERSKLEQNKFMASIIDSIKMNVVEFMENLTNGEKYESMIYEWGVNLFDDGKSIEEAVKIVHERRMLIVFNSSYNSSSREEYVSIKNHQKIMDELKSIPTYYNLNQKQKASIQIKIDALVASKLRTHSELIEIVLNIIKNNFINKALKTKANNKSRDGLDSDNNESEFLSRFKNYIHPKTILNGTILQ